MLNQGAIHTVNGRVVGSVAEQIELGVKVRGSLRVPGQVHSLVNEEYGTLAFTGNSIDIRETTLEVQCPVQDTQQQKVIR